MRMIFNPVRWNTVARRIKKGCAFIILIPCAFVIRITCAMLKATYRLQFDYNPMKSSRWIKLGPLYSSSPRTVCSLAHTALASAVREVGGKEQTGLRKHCCMMVVNGVDEFARRNFAPEAKQ